MVWFTDDVHWNAVIRKERGRVVFEANSGDFKGQEGNPRVR